MKNVQYYMMVYNRSKEGDRNMNILFFQWFAFMQKGIENALKKMNVSYDVFYYEMMVSLRESCLTILRIVMLHMMLCFQ